MTLGFYLFLVTFRRIHREKNENAAVNDHGSLAFFNDNQVRLVVLLRLCLILRHSNKRGNIQDKSVRADYPCHPYLPILSSCRVTLLLSNYVGLYSKMLIILNF